jgi:hypothetical protein
MSAEIFKKHGALEVADMIPIEFCHFFTHVLMHAGDILRYKNMRTGDEQIPNAASKLEHEPMFETLQERLWPVIENLTGLQLYPTYTYARLYTNGDVLEKHSDRPSCEISVTLQLGRSHHYAWPIYMGGKRFDLAEGSAVIYRGYDIEHWRDKCDGPPDYYSGQVFLHYVDRNGPFTEYAGDGKHRPGYIRTYHPYRTYAMESK